MLFGQDTAPVKTGRSKIADTNRLHGSKRGMEAVKHVCPYCGHHKAFYKRHLGGYECTSCKMVDKNSKFTFNKKIANLFAKRKRADFNG